MTTLRAILQRRDAIRTDLSAILDAHPDGNLPDEVRTRADALEQEAGRLLDMERRQAAVDEMDRRAQGVPLDASADSFDGAARAVGVTDVLRAAAGATDSAAGRAAEVSAEIARRSGRQPSGIYWDASRSTTAARAAYERRVFGTLIPGGGPGGALVATDVSTAVIDLLMPKLIIARLGATVLNGLVGNLAIPRIKQWPSTFWVSENSALTVTDPQSEQVTMTPHHVGGVVELTRQLMMQSSVDVMRLVENILISGVAQAIDNAALAGTGTVQPVGILNASSGVAVLGGGTNGAAPTWNNLMAMVSAVDQANALDGRLGWAGNAKITSVLRRTLRTTGDTSSNFIMSDPATLLGYPFQSTQNVTSAGVKGTGTALSSLIFGDWSALMIGYWSALDLAVNTQGDSVFLKGNVQCRCMASLDIQLRHPQAFSAMTDLITT